MSEVEAPTFFVPEIEVGRMEEVYVAFGGMAGVPVPEPDKRVYSISFRSNGEVWTATVGQPLRGTKNLTKTVRGKRIEREVPLSNSSIVMAIFPGSPFRVWHNETSTFFANPFLAGDPFSIVMFRPADD